MAAETVAGGAPSVRGGGLHPATKIAVWRMELHRRPPGHYTCFAAVPQHEGTVEIEAESGVGWDDVVLVQVWNDARDRVLEWDVYTPLDFAAPLVAEGSLP